MPSASGHERVETKRFWRGLKDDSRARKTAGFAGAMSLGFWRGPMIASSLGDLVAATHLAEPMESAGYGNAGEGGVLKASEVEE